MQNPDEDTEWNDVLRAKGILPPKKELEVDEDTVVQVSYNYVELELQKCIYIYIYIYRYNNQVVAITTLI